MFVYRHFEAQNIICFTIMCTRYNHNQAKGSALEMGCRAGRNGDRSEGRKKRKTERKEERGGRRVENKVKRK